MGRDRRGGADAVAIEDRAEGGLRVNATLGFGRSHIASLISRFVRQWPEVEVQLQLSVNPPPLTDDAYDVGIRFGEPPDARVFAPDSRRSAGCFAPHPHT